jgi:hypothetical protein
MKLPSLLILLILLSSCKGDGYYGVIYDFESKRPVAGVEIDDYLNDKKTVSDSSGHFLLDHKGRLSGRLIFKMAGYVTDTLETISNMNGEQIIERFKGDTVCLFPLTSNFRDSINQLNGVPAKRLNNSKTNFSGD